MSIYDIYRDSIKTSCFCFSPQATIALPGTSPRPSLWQVAM